MNKQVPLHKGGHVRTHITKLCKLFAIAHANCWKSNEDACMLIVYINAVDINSVDGFSLQAQTDTSDVSLPGLE